MIAACVWRGSQAGGVNEYGMYVEGWSGRRCL